MNDYRDRSYLSAIEAAKYLGVTVAQVHQLAKTKGVKCISAASGQKRFDLQDLQQFSQNIQRSHGIKRIISPTTTLHLNGTTQRIFIKSAMSMDELPDESVHLMVTSPPYFNAKMYSKESIEEDLGNTHDLNEWFEKISRVWSEVFRVLQPGRKAFINIMNLPIREKTSFRMLNLAGRTVEVMEQIGFIFKRDIVWHKTNGVKAHFGTYPYPGGILINNMHEFILEFNKPNRHGFDKYGHLTKEQKEASKLDKDFWLLLKNSDVWLMKPANSGDGRSHVAPFPYELPFRIIKAFSYVSEIVLDPFLGSGTSLKAAINLNRNGVGYEIVPEIAETATNSLRNYQANLF